MAGGYSFNLHEYCSHCDNFSPELNQMDITTCGDKKRRVLNTISCENANKCERLIESLKIGSA